jgi:hypothetical protein
MTGQIAWAGNGPRFGKIGQFKEKAMACVKNNRVLMAPQGSTKSSRQVLNSPGELLRTGASREIFVLCCDNPGDAAMYAIALGKWAGAKAAKAANLSISIAAKEGAKKEKDSEIQRGVLYQRARTKWASQAILLANLAGYMIKKVREKKAEMADSDPLSKKRAEQIALEAVPPGPLRQLSGKGGPVYKRAAKMIVNEAFSKISSANPDALLKVATIEGNEKSLDALDDPSKSLVAKLMGFLNTSEATKKRNPAGKKAAQLLRADLENRFEDFF